jgi:hypothetical protein
MQGSGFRAQAGCTAATATLSFAHVSASKFSGSLGFSVVVEGLRFEVQGLRFQVQSSEVMAEDLGFRV